MPFIWGGGLNALVGIGGLVMLIIGAIATWWKPVGQLGSSFWSVLIFSVGLIIVLVSLFALPGILY